LVLVFFFGAWRCQASKNVPLVKLVSVSFGCGKGGGEEGGEGGRGRGITVPGVKKCSVGQFGVGQFFLVHGGAWRRKMFRWSNWCRSLAWCASRRQANINKFVFCFNVCSRLITGCFSYRNPTGSTQDPQGSPGDSFLISFSYRDPTGTFQDPQGSPGEPFRSVFLTGTPQGLPRIPRDP